MSSCGSCGKGNANKKQDNGDGCGCPQPVTPCVKDNCAPQWCPPVCGHENDMLGEEVGVKYKEAVVKITSQFYFTKQTNARERPGDVETVYVKGNGFFTNKHVIVCPASLVLAPPNHTLIYNRWPSGENSILQSPLAALPAIPGYVPLPTVAGPATAPTGPFTVFNGDVMTRANRFLVDVYNVNGSEHSYTYEATLIGLSGVGDVALLWIDSSLRWNQSVPCIKACHPHLQFGCSRKVRPGEKAFLIGDTATRKGNGGQFYYNAPVTATQLQSGLADVVLDGNIGGVKGLSNVFSNGNVVPQGNSGTFVCETSIAHQRYVDHVGYAQQELVAVCANVFAGNVGSVVLDRFGHFIAMITLNNVGSVQRFDGSGTRNDTFLGGVDVPGKNGTVPDNGDGVVAGPSQFFLLHIIKTLLAPNDPCNQPFVEKVNDILGNYWRFTQAYLGVAWEVFDGSMYLSYRSNSAGQFGVFKDFIDANAEAIKEIIGLRVVGLADDQLAFLDGSSDDVHLPNFNVEITRDPAGVITQIKDLPNNNPLNGAGVPVPQRVRRNDVIVKAEACPLGDLNLQIPLSLVLFRKAPGETVKLCIRTTSAADYSSAAGYNSIYLLKAVSQKMKKFWDYPWYKYSSFPWNQLAEFTAFMDRFPNETGNTVSNGSPTGVAVHATIPVI